MLTQRHSAENVNICLHELSELVSRDLYSSSGMSTLHDLSALKESLAPRLWIPTGSQQCLLCCEPISSGCAQGYVVSSPQVGLALKRDGKDVLIISSDGRFSTLNGLSAFDGLILLGGTTSSHAAIVARSLGVPAVLLGPASRARFFQEWQPTAVDLRCSIDGGHGRLFFGDCQIVEPNPKVPQQLMAWCQKAEAVLRMHGRLPLSIMANADTPHEAARAMQAGAQGIAGCRIEHMFLTDKRLRVIQQMLIMPPGSARDRVCQICKNIIEDDVKQMLRIVSPHRFMIRLMDAPPMEFLPQSVEEVEDFCREAGLLAADYYRLAESMLATDSMVGIRGCRFGLINEVSYLAQIEGILRAGAVVSAEGTLVRLTIVVPFVRAAEELLRVSKQIQSVQEKVSAEYKTSFEVGIGTMIEIPRAALIADELAKTCEVFVFGTNDLTQFTHALSRNGGHSEYESALRLVDPFRKIDVQGVGQLILWALKKGRTANRKLVAGVCGEHVNNLDSLAFLHKTGMDFMSCISSNVIFVRTFSLYRSLLLLQKIIYRSGAE